jgi:hypothetical protein
VRYSGSRLESFWHPCWEKWRRTIITCFIVFNITAIASGTTRPPTQQNIAQKFFEPYLVWTRLKQGWALFAPTPRRYIKKYYAEITFHDGRKTTWQRPYPPNWDFFERHLGYQFQKWDLAANYLEEPGYSNLLLADWGDYLARLFANASNPPEKIDFYRTREDMPPPNPTGYVEPDFSHLQKSVMLLRTYMIKSRSLQ